MAPPRSRAAAVLLTLTGLGLGYGYLRRWRWAGLQVAGSAALVAVAFWTDAASAPWLWRAVAAAWLGLAGVAAWRFAARHLRPAGRRQRVGPAAVGVLALAALVAGYLVYGVAGRRAYDDGVAALVRADCATATDRFDEVTGRYELTLSRDVAAAEENRAECARFVAATRAEGQGSYQDAVRGYRELRTDRPDSLLAPALHQRLKSTYAAWARDLRQDRDYPDAIRIYRDLLAEAGSDPDAQQARADLADTYLAQAAGWQAELSTSTPPSVADVSPIFDNLALIGREFPGTPAAATVPRAVATAFAAANRPFAMRQYCQSLPVLDYVTGLDRRFLGAVFATAHRDRAVAMVECGLGEFRAGRYADAVTRLEGFLDGYPRHARVAQARSALIAARVADEAHVRLPLPPPLGGNSPGPISVTFYNDTSQPSHVLVAGATAHEFTLPACPGCPSDYAPGARTCPTFTGRPSLTLSLAPGTYHVVVDQPESLNEHLVDTIVLAPGFTYTQCLFVVRS